MLVLETPHEPIAGGLVHMTTPEPTLGAGDLVIFHYSGDPDGAPTYMAVDGHEGTIARPLTADEADIADVGRMFRVSFGTGNDIDAFADELTLVRSAGVTA